MTRSRMQPVLVAVAAFAMMSCSEGAAPVEGGPLSGLAKSTLTDSAGTTPPPTPASPSPGYFRGVVRSSEGAQGPDTLGTSIKIPNVRVAAYPRLTSAPGDTKTGPLAASVTTDANGLFQLPELAGGEYVVTFTPPDGSKYLGVWVTATAHGQSSQYPWWVTLPTR
jgi:hypothetical protein